ncbi:hypothetical protein Tco_0374331 [Tanacetum coccineum]
MCNMDLSEAGVERNNQLNELEELRLQAYETSKTYKESTKRWHDNRLKEKKEFQTGDRVLLFNSKLKLFLGKLKSRWSGPFTVKQAYPYGTIELFNHDGTSFKMNGHRLKHYHEEPFNKNGKESLAAGIFEEKKKKSSLQTLETASGLILTASPESRDGVASIKRRRHDLRSNGVSTLVTPSEHGRPKGTLEDSVSRD